MVKIHRLLLMVDTCNAAKQTAGDYRKVNCLLTNSIVSVSGKQAETPNAGAYLLRIKLPVLIFSAFLLYLLYEI